MKGYDYSSEGAYFVTICTHERQILLDDSAVERIVLERWNALPTKFPGTRTDQFVIMPNHVHGIAFIESPALGHSVHPTHGQSHGIAPTVPALRLDSHSRISLAKIVQWFKTMTTNDYIRAVRTHEVRPFQRRLRQRNYYEHVIRNEQELDILREYILGNPFRWQEDEENPVNCAVTDAAAHAQKP